MFEHDLLYGPIKKVQQNWKISYIVCTEVMQVCGQKSSGRLGQADRGLCWALQ